MNLRSRTLIGTCLALFSIATAMPPLNADAATPGVEELTRGPVHEAFAESVSFDPEPGMIVNSSPPSPIEEMPPDQQPVGTNIAWIPGYWSWDDDQSEFIWISGIWRDLPPGRQWIPGYWASVGSDWQWTSGYWEDESNQEVTYLPRPPKTIEAGPSAKASSDDQIWVSGNWIYNEDRYAWRPGYWETAREDWIWVPAHYQWTRRGYVFVEGYWDYDIDRRGTVFAPVRFHRDVYSRPDYYYTPTTAIVLNVFLNHLFVRPRYSHYYFGDYYEPRYRDNGYYAPYAYQSNRGGYDPIYVHNRWRHRDDRNWDRERQDNFEYYRDNERQRPPRTFAALAALTNDDRKDRRDKFDIAESLTRYAENRDGDKNRRRFQSVDKQQRDQFVEQRKELRNFSDNRRQMEGRENPRGKNDDGPAAILREKITRSPLVGKSLDQLTGKEAPPARPQARQQRGNDNDKSGTDRRPGRETSDIPRRGERGEMPGKDREPQKGPANRGEDNRPTPETAAREAIRKEAERKGVPGMTRDRDQDREPGNGRPEPKPQPANPQRGEDRSRRDNDTPTPDRRRDVPAPEMKREPSPQRPQKGPDDTHQRQIRRQPEVPVVPEKTPPPQRKAEPQPQRRSEPKADQRPPQKSQPEQAAPQRQEQRPQKTPSAPQQDRRAEPKKAPAGGPSGSGRGGKKDKD